MYVQDFTLDDYEWYVKVYYAIDGYSYEDIRRDLISLGCEPEEVQDTLLEISHMGYDDAKIMSNTFARRSLIIFSPSSSSDEFLDTWDHEKGHLAMHICITDNLDPYSEEYQYLTGNIGKQMFRVVKKLLCDKCREHLCNEE